MRRFLMTFTAAAAVLTTGALLPNAAQATPMGTPTGLQLALDGMSPIQNVAVCFYADGWNGPGLYECGYRHRTGQGWHGRRDEGNRRGRDMDRDRGRTQGRGGVQIEVPGMGQPEERGRR